MHAPPAFLGVIHKIFQMELATAKHAKAKLAGKVVRKSYLCPQAAHDYRSVKDIRHGVQQIIGASPTLSVKVQIFSVYIYIYIYIYIIMDICTSFRKF